MLLFFILLAMLIYGSASFYVGLRLLPAYSVLWAGGALYYWVVYSLLTLTPFFARVHSMAMPVWLTEVSVQIGDYWLATFYYLWLFWVGADIVKFVANLFSYLWSFSQATLGFAALAVVLLLLVYGTYNACHTHIKSFDIAIAKASPNREALQAVLVSDVHLGVRINRPRLEKLVRAINDLDPEIVFFVGDIIDGDVRPFVRQNMAEVLQSLNAPLGAYAVMGNHEYLGGQGEMAARQLRQAGLTVLRDEVVNVLGQFYIVGREDRSSERFRGQPRQELSELMKPVDSALPVFLLDHQPWSLTTAEAAGADLQLSGHTHHGQFFPNNLVTALLFEKDWGYLRKGLLQVVVSCGYATWGPPIRIGSHSELVSFRITFNK